MAQIQKDLILKLRQRTGLGMMECRKALEETGGDVEAAIELLRKRGVEMAGKRSGRETGHGLVHAYIHPGATIGVMVEINCETDFVAATEDIKEFAKDLCLHITALKPLYLAPEDIDEKLIEHEKSIIKEQLAGAGKPEKFIDQIVEGKINKLGSEICLLKQSFVKNDQFTVEDVVKQLIAKTGENIRIKRFARFEIGE